MDTFDYTAIDRAGSRSRGTLSAPSLRDARDMLRVRELTPVALKPARAKKDAATAALGGRIRHKDRVLATRQLAILVGADQPVEESLKLVALQFEKSPLRAVLLDVRTRVVEGARLSQAMQAHPKAFPPLYTAMVASGEGAGTLARVLDRLAQDLEAAQAVRRRILAATAYPIVLLAVALIVVVVLMVLVVPQVVESFESFGEELPPLTRAVIAISEFLQAAWWLLLLGGVGLAVGVWQLSKTPRIGLALARFRLRLPIAGRLVRILNTSRFARTLASLIDAGTPPLAAMETARHTITNREMRDAVDEAVVRVREGSSISRALGRSEVFPPLVVQMVAGGESSGDIASMFTKSADYLEGEFESSTAVVLALLEPLIIILLAVVVLLIIGAIFLPILRLNTMLI